MLELLQTGQRFVVDILSALWGLVALIFGLVHDTLYHLHVNAPVLEGLLLGVLLAWVLLRRDRHPWLRVVSAPLKLVLDILDLAWDQVVEVAGDLWSVPLVWVRSGWGWCVAKVRAVYNWKMGLLRSLRDRLLNRGGNE